jgi:hypothetical protein
MVGILPLDKDEPLQGICFRARRTGDGQNADGRRGVRGYGRELLIQCREIRPYEPAPEYTVNIDAAARMLGLSRRTIVICCKYGLIASSADPVQAGWCFDSRSIRVLRKIEALRALCAGHLPAICTILKLETEVDRLGAELRAHFPQGGG